MEANLRLNTREGLDKPQVGCLMEVCLYADIGFYFASCETTASGGCVDDGSGYKHSSHPGGHPSSNGYHRIQAVVESSKADVEGTILTQDIDIMEDDFV